MAFTFSKLASVAVGSGGSSTISFTNIPQNYKDLVIKLSIRSATGGSNDGVLMRANNIISGYTTKILWADGTNVSTETNPYGATTAYYVTSAVVASGFTTNTFSSCDVYIPNYSSSSNKSMLADTTQENNATYSFMTLDSGVLVNTSAISSLSIYTTSGSGFVQYSTATLYGIRAEL